MRLALWLNNDCGGLLVSQSHGPRSKQQQAQAREDLHYPAWPFQNIYLDYIIHIWKIHFKKYTFDDKYISEKEKDLFYLTFCLSARDSRIERVHKMSYLWAGIVSIWHGARVDKRDEIEEEDILLCCSWLIGITRVKVALAASKHLNSDAGAVYWLSCVWSLPFTVCRLCSLNGI